MDEVGLSRFSLFEAAIGLFSASEGSELVRGEGEEVVFDHVGWIILGAIGPAKDFGSGAGNFFEFIGMFDEFFAVEGFEVFASFEGSASEGVSGEGIFLAERIGGGLGGKVSSGGLGLASSERSFV